MSCTEIYSYTFCNNLALAILLGGVVASSYWFRRAYRSFFASRRRYRQRPYRPRYRKQNRSRYGARRYQTVKTKKLSGCILIELSGHHEDPSERYLQRGDWL